MVHSKRGKRQEHIAAKPIFVACQPIFNRKNAIWAHELLFRDSDVAEYARFVDPNRATLDVISEGFSIAQTSLGSEKRLFINFPQELLLNESAFALPPKTCVVELLEDISPVDSVLRACAKLKQNGYLLALDDYVGQPEFEGLLDILDIVKVDILKLDPRAIQELISRLQSRRLTLIAEKIESLRIFNMCLTMGFDLFQGFFFCRPQIFPGSKITSTQYSRFHIIQELSRDDLDIKELAQIVQKDALLSYRLLKFINSAYFGLRSTIHSIQHAISLLGLRQTSQWLRVIILSDVGDSPFISPLTALSAQRAKFLESIAALYPDQNLQPQELFLVGLLSLLDAILGQSMETILENLPLEERIAKVLAHSPTEPQAVWLDLMQAHERGRWAEVDSLIEQLGLHPETVAQTFALSLRWSHAALGFGEEADSPSQ